MECSGKAMSHDFVKSAMKDQLPGMVRPMFPRFEDTLFLFQVTYLIWWGTQMGKSLLLVPACNQRLFVTNSIDFLN